MPDRGASILERVRQPEYTGENRCIPCTIVNAVIALFASALVALVAVELGVIALGCFLLVVYLRGYLVPGTPALTERYVPERVLARFDAHPVSATTEESFETLEKLEERRNRAVDPVQFLLEVDAVATRDDGSDLRLTDAVADEVERWIERFRDDRVGPAAVADLFDVERDAVTAEDREYPAFKIGRRIRRWPGDAALAADVATHEALLDRTDRWMDVPLEQRLEMLESLRSFHDACPLCAGDVRLGEDTVESCCRSFEVVSLVCVGCDEPLLEFDPEEVASGDTGEGIRP